MLKYIESKYFVIKKIFDIIYIRNLGDNMERITIVDNEKILRQVSSEIDFIYDDYQMYIKKLKDYCSSNSVYALAPVQIGIPKRIIYIKNSSQNMDNNIKDDYDESLIYINPKIISQRGHTRFLEGCASCAYLKENIRIYYVGVVDRPYSIEIEFYDNNGKLHKKELEGFEATVFCHEYDHLNGILHIDRANEVFEMTLDEMREYRTKHKQEILSKTCDYNELFKNRKL